MTVGVDHPLFNSVPKHVSGMTGVANCYASHLSVKLSYSAQATITGEVLLRASHVGESIYNCVLLDRGPATTPSCANFGDRTGDLSRFLASTLP